MTEKSQHIIHTPMGHWMGDVHSGSFAPIFTLSLADSECSLKQQMTIASDIMPYYRKKRHYKLKTRKMNYQNRILCYFDILGFGDNVKNKTKEANEINHLFEEIASIIEEYSNDENDIQISHFSDSFVISILKPQNSPTQLKFVVYILIKLLEYQLIARGVIVYGELIHTSKHIFGPALVKADNLEKTDLYPRIVIDESLSNLIMPTIGGNPISYSNFFNDFVYVKTDSTDSKKYIDFFGEIIKKEAAVKNELIETIKKLIDKQINNENLFTKYEWLRLKLEELDF